MRKIIGILLATLLLLMMCSCMSTQRYTNVSSYQNVFGQTEITVQMCKCTAVVDTSNQVIRMFAINADGMVFLYDGKTGVAKLIYKKGVRRVNKE